MMACGPARWQQCWHKEDEYTEGNVTRWQQVASHLQQDDHLLDVGAEPPLNVHGLLLAQVAYHLEQQLVTRLECPPYQPVKAVALA
jgi:hypothetical protein